MTQERPSIARSGRVPVLSLVPNMITLGGMCIGLTSIRFAMDERFGAAMTLLLLAAVFDGLDGLLARSLRATSRIGAELDSLSDFLCFGVAPGLLLYQWTLSGLGSFGWVFVLIFSSASSLRLARFNVDLGAGPGNESPKGYFVGVPAPGAALLVLFPAFVEQAGIVSVTDAPWVVALWSVVVALGMVSRVHTPSPKALRIRAGAIWLLMLAMVVAIGLLFTRPWLVLVAADLAYCGVLARTFTRSWRGNAFDRA